MTRETLDPALFALPPDHIVVALRSRTGHEHLGWRKPSRAERLRCAALLASDEFDRLRADLTPVERSILQPASPLTDSTRIRRLVDLIDQNPGVQGGTKVLAGIHAAQELLAWLTAVQAAQLTRLAEPGCAGDPTDLAHAAARIDPDLSDDEPDSAHWTLAGTQLAVGHLGAELCISPISAGYRISDAQDLVDNLPDLHAALAAGAIDPTRARILQQRTKVLDRLDDRRNVVRRLLPEAMRHNPGRFATLVDGAVIEADPDAAEQRHRDALERRGLRLDQFEDGMARFIAQLPAADAQLAYDLFDSIAQGLKGFDDRCASHRRADAFTTMIELLAAGQTVSAETLLHQAVTATCTCRRPADVADPTAAEADANASDSAAGTTTEAATKPPEDADRRGDVDSQDSVADAENETATEAADLASSESDSGPQYSAGGAENETATEAAELATCECGAGPQDSAGGAENDFGPVLVGCPAPGGAPCSCPEPGNDELCSGACTAAAGKQWSLPTRQGRRTHATVVLPWDAFSRLDGTVAELLDYGMITAAWARTLLEAAATVTMLVTDPVTGRSVAVGERTYRPKQDVRDKVTTAYPTCIFTGCSRPSRQCDCEHCIPFNHRHPDRGGSSDTGNLFPVCRFHHRLKTFGGYDYAAHPDGVHITSPLGQATVSLARPTDSWPAGGGSTPEDRIDPPPDGTDPPPDGTDPPPF